MCFLYFYLVLCIHVLSESIILIVTKGDVVDVFRPEMLYFYCTIEFYSFLQKSNKD